MPAILSVALPVFGVILAGYLAGRFRVLGGGSTAAVTTFVGTFALPGLFFGTLARMPVEMVLDPALIAGFGLPVVLTFAVGMLSTRLAVKGGLARMSLQGVAASWGNVGYMGVPLCLAVFGDAGLPPAMLSVIVTAVVSMVFGVLMIELEVAAGHGPVLAFLRTAWRAARNPLPVSIAAGLAWSALALPLPTPVEKWLDLLGAAVAPCALFATGLFLCNKPVSDTGQPVSDTGQSICTGLAEASLATAIKLVLQPLLVACLLPLFIDLKSVPGQAALILAALPTAANAFVLAKQFDIAVEQNTAAVLLSTALSVISVSALLVWLHVT